MAFLEKLAPAPAPTAPVPSNDTPSAYAADAMTWAIQNGVVFGWHDTPTKEQVAVVLCRASKMPKA